MHKTDLLKKTLIWDIKFAVFRLYNEKFVKFEKLKQKLKDSSDLLVTSEFKELFSILELFLTQQQHFYLR